MGRPLALAAPWVLPVSGPPLENAVVCVDKGRISALGRRRELSLPAGAELRELDGCAIVPGLINAHCHLELTDLRGRAPYWGNFASWLLRVAAERARLTHRPEESARRGLLLAEGAGTTTIVDVTNAWVVPEGRARVISLFEVLGLAPARAQTRLAELDRAAEQALAAGRLVGVSPHAVYTTCAELYRGCAELAARRGLVFGTHVAEVPQENELTRSGTSFFSPILERLGGRPRDWQPPGVSAIAYLDQLGCLGPRALLFHCNYADDEDIALIARRGASVVFCPRSHRFFGHTAHPLPAMLRAGVRVCLGTDSLASNESLDMRAETAAALEQFPELKPGQALKLATLAPAQALGMGQTLGSLEVGRAAELVAFPLADRRDPYSFIFSDEPPALVLFPKHGTSAE